MRHLHCSSLPIALMLLAVFAGDSLALKPHARGGWLFGVGYGTGRGNLKDAVLGETEYQDGPMPQLRVGKFLGERVMVGFEYQGWLYELGDIEERYRRSLQNFALGATWFPGNPQNAWGGLFLRGGIGSGLAGTAVTYLDEEQEEILQIREDEWGLGLMAGIGYEFRISGAFAVGAALSANYFSIDRDFVESGWFTGVTLNGNWYF